MAARTTARGAAKPARTAAKSRRKPTDIDVAELRARLDANDQHLLTQVEMEAVLGPVCSASNLRYWLDHRPEEGPPVTRIGKRLAYRWCEVLSWLEICTEDPLSAEPRKPQCLVRGMTQQI